MELCLLTSRCRITAEKRKKFIAFISDGANVVNDKFRLSFNRFLDSIHNKINPKIFEIILKIGVNFMKDDDSFWFHLIVSNRMFVNVHFY